MYNHAFTDQLGRSISLSHPSQRIISLVPSQTELLFDLGLDAEIIGITKFCIHPKSKIKGITKIGGTKALDLDLIRTLKPDLIIGNKEENEQTQVETLMQEFSVWMSDIYTLADALQMINSVGTLVNREEPASQMVQQIQSGFHALIKSPKRQSVAYLIWQKPYMLAAKNTFIDDMLQSCGFKNAFNTQRYPQITTKELQAANPDIIMLSSEPFPFRQKHIDAIQQICPSSNVILVDGEMFSWYGSRLLQAPAYFQQLINTLNK